MSRSYYIMNEKINMEITQTHINTLQSIISRHADYSLNCKTWCVTIISAMIIFFYEERQTLNRFILFLPIIIFYLLDCYYMGLERLFRQKYNEFIERLQTDSKIENDIILNIKIKEKIIYSLKGFISLSTTPIYLIMCIFIFLIYKGV